MHAERTDLALVPALPEYAEQFYEWRQDEDLKRFNPVENTSVAELKRRLHESVPDLSQTHRRPNMRWFIKWEDKLVGSVALSNINNRMKHAELGYVIAKEFRGQGFGRHAVKLALDLTFSQSDLQRIMALVSASNTASRRLIESVGFQQEGILRKHYFVDGKWTDEILYAVLREEFVEN